MCAALMIVWHSWLGRKQFLLKERRGMVAPFDERPALPAGPEAISPIGEKRRPRTTLRRSAIAGRRGDATSRYLLKFGTE